MYHQERYHHLLAGYSSILDGYYIILCKAFCCTEAAKALINIYGLDSGASIGCAYDVLCNECHYMIVICALSSTLRKMECGCSP